MTKTTHIRIGVKTRARLDVERERLEKAYAEGRTESVRMGSSLNPTLAGVSYDALIERLLDLDAATRRRRVQSAARRRKRAE